MVIGIQLLIPVLTCPLRMSK